MTNPDGGQCSFVSLLTPAGVGAIAVLRIEGPAAAAVLARVFHPHRGVTVWQTDRVVHGEIRAGDEPLDDVLVVPQRPSHAASAPNIHTPAAFDICVHGGLRVVERVAMTLTDAGALFTGRADAAAVWPAASTIEREIWDGLARARTRRAVRFLLRQRSALVHELHRIARLAERAAAAAALQALLSRAPGARALVDGATVVLSGPPNAGKSTLANCLSGAEQALVSPRPGTTLDWVTAETALDGIPVTLVDTPGHSDSGATLDRLAAERARARATTANVQLLVFDGSCRPPADRSAWRVEGAAVQVVLNKCDLGAAWTPADVAAQSGRPAISISAAHGTGVAELTREIGCMLGVDWADDEVISLFTERQMRLVREWLGAERDPNLTGSIMAELVGADSLRI